MDGKEGMTFASLGTIAATIVGRLEDQMDISIFQFSVYDLTRIRAEFDEFNGHQWVAIFFTGKNATELKSATLFFTDRVAAKAYADAINGVRIAPPSDSPLTDEEERDIIGRNGWPVDELSGRQAVAKVDEQEAA